MVPTIFGVRGAPVRGNEPAAGRAQRLRAAPGVMPVQRLYARVKLAASEYPSVAAMRSIDCEPLSTRRAYGTKTMR